MRGSGIDKPDRQPVAQDSLRQGWKARFQIEGFAIYAEGDVDATQACGWLSSQGGVRRLCEQAHGA